MEQSSRSRIVAILTRYIHFEPHVFYYSPNPYKYPKKRQNPPPRRWFKIVKAKANKACTRDIKLG